MNEDPWLSTEGTRPKESLENVQGMHVKRRMKNSGKKKLCIKMYLLIHCI